MRTLSSHGWDLLEKGPLSGFLENVVAHKWMRPKACKHGQSIKRRRYHNQIESENIRNISPHTCSINKQGNRELSQLCIIIILDLLEFYEILKSRKRHHSLWTSCSFLPLLSPPEMQPGPMRTEPEKLVIWKAFEKESSRLS